MAKKKKNNDQHTQGKQIKKEIILKDAFLKISFFRIDPVEENNLLKSIKKCISNNEKEKKPLFYKGLGHYDIICLYQHTGEHRILFSGSIKGVRSFSNLDCVCCNNPTKIIETLETNKLIAVTTISFKKEALFNIEECIIKISNVINKCGFQLISSSWGEYVLLNYANSMSKLLDQTRNIIKELGGYSIDIHIVIGINMDTVKEIDKNNNCLPDKISKNLLLEWQVKLKDTEKSFYQFIEKLNKLETDKKIQDFEILKKYYSIDKSKIILNIYGNSWGSIIKAIRTIRQESKEQLVSTTLNLLYKKT